MTRDYFHDFIEACEKEGWGYMAFMVDPGGNEVRGIWDLSMMMIDRDKTIKADIIDMLDAMGMFDESTGKNFNED